MTFKDLQLIEPIQKALNDAQYEQPTPIQQKAIPIILAKKDVLGSAQTGTGKTAAFCIPIIQFLSEGDRPKNRRIRALIVTPTRELAIQIGENIDLYSRYTSIKNTVIFGGVKQGPQVQKIQSGVDIMVATPGRLLDLHNQGFIDLGHIKYFVLDEADRMLDMGFVNDIRKLLNLIPKKRQSLFFSATLPDNILKLSQKILIDPVKIEVSPVSSTAETIKQYLYYTNKADKKQLLIHLLKEEEIEQALLFSKTKHGADRIVKDLQKHNIHSAAIHGDKAQNFRQKVLSQFKEGKLQVLVATDIASRGIDIDKLRYVINYDIPDMPESYVHRIGRSGRAGESGVAFAFAEPEENQFIKDIEYLTKQKITVIEDHPFPQTDKPMSSHQKKEFNKEKQLKKQAFFSNRKNNRR